MNAQHDARLKVGDRVIVHPVSAIHAHLRGTEGTIVQVLRAGALYVLLDSTGDTIGIGSDCVRGTT